MLRSANGENRLIVKRLPEEVIDFLHKQGFVVVSTIDKDGSAHSSCKGIVKINQNGRIYLLDLYKEKTYENLQHNSRITLTSVDEHRFRGFCLKGRAKIAREGKLSHHIIRAWEKRLTHRLTQRVLKNIRGEKGHARHPEALMPRPEYMIMMEVKEVVDLTPHQLK